MRATDLAVKMPVVRASDSVAHAVRVMADNNLPGLVIVDEHERPRFVLRDTQVLRLMVSQYGNDSALARTIDEDSADQFWSGMVAQSITDYLEPAEGKSATVRCDATVLEVTVTMSRLRSPLVAVVDADQRLVGCITLNILLERAVLPTM
jgi:CBS domain-containing protein